ncbi:MAG: hypothetical protein ACK5MD_10600 [Flavobacteriales bacterium]
MDKQIIELRKKLQEYSLTEDSFSYVGQRLRIIRRELLKEDKIFEIQFISKVIGVSKAALGYIEKGQSTSFDNIMLLVNLYKLHGYNPDWILTRENFFIEKKISGFENQLILDKTSVEIAVNELLKELKNAQNINESAIEQFKKDMK